jgi:RimJ/RimL family protein N-acetyltransferase
MSDKRPLPRSVECEGVTLELRFMTPVDELALLAFAESLPVHDMLFLPRDIAQPKVLAAWVREVERGALPTLLAVQDGRVVGCAAMARDLQSWSPHFAELRAVVAPELRGKGVGRTLVQECFAILLAEDIEKITAQMTIDQQGAIAVFEALGFRAEALLRDYVKDREGKKHDIVILSHDVAKVMAQMEAYGVTQAF